MARYRKIDIRVWGDQKFRALSPIPPCGQGLWFYLLTGRETGIIPGLLVAGQAAIAESLGWQPKAFYEAFHEVLREGLAIVDWKAPLIWVPNAIRYNHPTSPNVVRSWADAWDEIPECPLKVQAWQQFKTFLEGLGEGFGKAFRESLPTPSVKTCPNQEQEQEQELSTLASSDKQPSLSAVFELPLIDGTEYEVSEELFGEFVKAYPAVTVMQEFGGMRAWLIANPKNKKTKSGIKRFMNSWLSRAQNEARIVKLPGLIPPPSPKANTAALDQVRAMQASARHQAHGGQA